MNPIFVFVLLFTLSCTAARANDIDTPKKQSVFDRITNELQAYRIDTSTPPADNITRTIREIRELRGGFNINEAIEYKIQELRNNHQTPEVDLNNLAIYLGQGEGRNRLDNAIIWIYRSTFNLKELKQIKAFYATSAGQKMAERFPVLMLKCLAAAQLLQDEFMKTKSR